MKNKQKSLGQLAYDALGKVGPWDDASPFTRDEYERMAQAVAREVRSEYGATAHSVTHPVRRRGKGKT